MKRINHILVTVMVLVMVAMFASALDVNKFGSDGTAGTGLNTSYGNNTTIAGVQTYLNFSLNASDDTDANLTSLNLTFPSEINISGLTDAANMTLTGFNSDITMANVTISSGNVLKICNSTAGGSIWNTTDGTCFSVNLTNTNNFTAMTTAAGTYSIVVNVTNVTGTISDGVTVYLTVNPGSANMIFNVSGMGQSGLVGAALSIPFVFQVNDTENNPIPNVAVNFTNTSGSSINRENGTTTNSSGQVNVTLTLGSIAGPYSVTCFVASNNSINDTISATANGPHDMINVSGMSQSGAIGTTLSNPFVFQVNDTNDNPVPNVAVNFTVNSGPEDDASASVSTGTTNAGGQVNVTLTLGTDAGTCGIMCEVNGTQRSTTRSMRQRML